MRRRCSFVIGVLALLRPDILIAADHGARAPEIAPIYARVDWPDRLNPAFAPLGQDRFLFSTRTGMQVWDAASNRFAPAAGWPAHTALPLNARWAQLDKRTVVVGSYHDDQQITRHRLLGWDSEQGKFLASTDVPSGWLVHHLIPVDEQNLVACLRPLKWDEWSIKAIPDGFAAWIVSWRNESMVWSGPSSIETLRAAGVRGPVTDVGDITDKPGSPAPPVHFDTQTCAWRMRSPPDAMAKGQHLAIKPYRLADGRTLIGQADWFVPDQGKVGQWARFRAPLLWDAAAERWQETPNTVALDNDPVGHRAFASHDRIVSLSDVSVAADANIAGGFIEFLDTDSFRWVRSQQLLPASFPPTKYLAPLSNGQVLAILGDGSGIVRLDPFVEASGRGFLTTHDRWGDALLSKRRLLLSSGDFNKEPYNRPEIVSIATGVSRPIAPLPEPMNNQSVVELPDRTILAFGGLPVRCGPYQDWNRCTEKPAMPAYRYFPRKDRWEVVPGLAPNFAGGPYLAAGNSSIANAWPRVDFQLARNGTLYFLDSGNWLRAHQSPPAETRLYRWRSGSPAKEIGKLRRPRIRASLIQLRDGRLLVVGGLSPSNASQNIAMGRTNDAAAGCEIFSVKTGRRQPCPRPHFAGGRAIKLADGRIFKLSMRDWTPEFGYRAEIADARVRRWTRLPDLPAKFGEASEIHAFGRQVLVLPDKAGKPVALWNDRRRRWSLARMDLPEYWVSILPLDSRRALVRTDATLKIIKLPR